MPRERPARRGAWDNNTNEKPPELPQGVIACHTPCALEPDVSEANNFSQIGRRSVHSGSRAISEETPSFAPRRHRRFALFESSGDYGSKNGALLYRLSQQQQVR